MITIKVLVLYYSTPAGERSIAISPSVCLSVCLCVCPRAYLWNRWTDIHEICCEILRSRGSVLLWRHCDTLCTSGFIDDATFCRNGPCEVEGGEGFLLFFLPIYAHVWRHLTAGTGIIAESLNPLSRAHERYRRQTDDRRIAIAKTRTGKIV